MKSWLHLRECTQHTCCHSRTAFLQFQIHTTKLLFSRFCLFFYALLAFHAFHNTFVNIAADLIRDPVELCGNLLHFLQTFIKFQDCSYRYGNINKNTDTKCNVLTDCQPLRYKQYQFTDQRMDDLYNKYTRCTPRRRKRNTHIAVQIKWNFRVIPPFVMK